MLDKTLKELMGDGLIKNMTNKDVVIGKHLRKKKVIYCGIDPTASSLHLGNLMPLMVLRKFQDAGHTPLILIGESTAMIGDPSGKSGVRKPLSRQSATFNAAKIKRQTERFFKFDCPNKPIYLSNYEWWSKTNIMLFMIQIGEHVNVNDMLHKSTAKRRLKEGGFSMLEFVYPLFQAFDFLVLKAMYRCSIQVGGSDQWGNITAGVDLVRKVHDEEVFGITTPLLLKPNGKKYGKSELGAIPIGDINGYDDFINTVKGIIK